MQYAYQTVDSNLAKDSVSVATKILTESKTFLDAIYSRKSFFPVIIGRKRIRHQNKKKKMLIRKEPQNVEFYENAMHIQKFKGEHSQQDRVYTAILCIFYESVRGSMGTMPNSGVIKCNAHMIYDEILGKSYFKLK